MFLKPKFFHLPFLKAKTFELTYESLEDLKSGVIKLLNKLKKNYFIVQVFSKENINIILKSHTKSKKISQGNFNYYIFEDCKFLENINFNKIRFMNIYSYLQTSLDPKELDQLIALSSFIIELDNYFEVTNLKIDLAQYPKNILDDFK